MLVDRDGWEQTLTLNVTGTWSLIRHAAPAMARSGGGSIVALSSIAGHLTHRHLGAYAVAKAGIEMLVRNAADELGAYGIRVNGVRPGLVPTDASGPLNDHAATAPTTSPRCRSVARAPSRTSPPSWRSSPARSRRGSRAS